MPESLSVSTIPRPKAACQSRLTVTLAVKEFDGSTSQRAGSIRFGVSEADFERGQDGRGQGGRHARRDDG